jgi:hypothetical protein
MYGELFLTEDLLLLQHAWGIPWALSVRATLIPGGFLRRIGLETVLQGCTSVNGNCPLHFRS